MESITLQSGNQIPLLGIGTWHITGNIKETVKYALKEGFRHIDTAQAYQNHREIGEAIKESRVPRSEIYITSKIWPSNYEAENVFPAIEKTLDELGVEYLDLWLMHWPVRNIPLEETLTEMKKLEDKGFVRDIGVSNFTVNHLKDVFNTGLTVSVNQVEFHPSLHQKELLRFCRKNNIALTAYSPLGRGEDMRLTKIQSIAQKYDRGANQVILNWLRQKEIIAIPKSQNPTHIKENWKALEWKLEMKDIERIDTLNKNNRLVSHDFANFNY